MIELEWGDEESEYPWMEPDAVPKTNAQLGPGDECEVRRVYRCAHCLQIKPWSNGGGGASDLELSAEEQEHLEASCDECWCAIVLPMEQAFARVAGQ